MELSRLIRAVLQWTKINVEWQIKDFPGIVGKHVPGHALHPWNEAVDSMACLASSGDFLTPLPTVVKEALYFHESLEWAFLQDTKLGRAYPDVVDGYMLHKESDDRCHAADGHVPAFIAELEK
eukprot:5234131-Karenia_brevis.AAC.1